MLQYDELNNEDSDINKLIEENAQNEELQQQETNHKKSAKNKRSPRQSNGEKQEQDIDDHVNLQEWKRSEKEIQLTDMLFGNKPRLIENLKLSVESVKLEKKDSSIKKRNRITPPNKNNEKQQLWYDSDDEQNADDVIDYERKGGPIVRKVGKYKRFLETNFKNVCGPTPKWAAPLKNEQPNDSDADDDDAVLQTVGHVIKENKSNALPAHLLHYKRLKDLNRATYCEGPIITGIEFHPTSTVALVTGINGIATIYSIDGSKNDKLHNIEFKKYRIRCCRLSGDGNQALIGGAKPYFYSYDLMTGQTARIFQPKEITQMSHFKISPCGKYIAVIGHFGQVYLLCYATKELLWTFKQEYPSIALEFSKDSGKLYSHSTDNEISIFDINARKLIHRFFDDGCLNGTAIALSECGRLFAAGSSQGVVNVYDTESLYGSRTPKPSKTILNLTTKITDIKFNATTEMLAICSNELYNAVKLCHFPSGTIFSNFINQQMKIGKPNCLAFSPKSGYLAIGNSNKEVPLFRLNHYSNY